jgi:hypothetical protein
VKVRCANLSCTGINCFLHSHKYTFQLCIYTGWAKIPSALLQEQCCITLDLVKSPTCCINYPCGIDPVTSNSTFFTKYCTFIHCNFYSTLCNTSDGCKQTFCLCLLFGSMFQKQFVLLPQKQLTCYYFMICSLLLFWFKDSLLQCDCRPVYLQKTHTLKS